MRVKLDNNAIIVAYKEGNPLGAAELTVTSSFFRFKIPVLEMEIISKIDRVFMKHVYPLTKRSNLGPLKKFLI